MERLRVFMYIPVAGFLATLFFLPKMPADNPIVTTVVSSPVLLTGSRQFDVQQNQVRLFRLDLVNYIVKILRRGCFIAVTLGVPGPAKRADGLRRRGAAPGIQ